MAHCVRLLLRAALPNSDQDPHHIPSAAFGDNHSHFDADIHTCACHFSVSLPTQQIFAERIPVIEYHYTNYRFSDDIRMTTEWFQDQLRTLADNGYTTITAGQPDVFLDGKHIPAKSVVLTFDVGTVQRADFTENIIPLLGNLHFHALFCRHKQYHR
jgi:hypothetical protein